MAGSPFYTRIRADVLTILRAVPAGQVVTYADIGAHLDVPARHVAYILSQLVDAEAEAVDPARAVRQADAALYSVVPVSSLDHGVPVQQRPADAPMPKPRKRR
jgi:hypothetical protein